MINAAERVREMRAVRLLIIAPVVIVVLPSLVVLAKIRTEEGALLYFVLTRPLIPALIIFWLTCGRRVRAFLRTQDAVLAEETGARSGGEVAVASYIGIFVPFVFFCALSAACVVLNASVGTQKAVVVTGTVDRLDFGRWTRTHSVTVRLAPGSDVRLPAEPRDAVDLHAGGPFAKAYTRGGLGLLYLPRERPRQN